MNCVLAGLIYMPEIKYRRILNQAFGPGGWALMPLGEVMHIQVSGTILLTIIFIAFVLE